MYAVAAVDRRNHAQRLKDAKAHRESMQERAQVLSDIVPLMERTRNPTMFIVGVHQLLVRRGFVIDIEELAMLGLCSWPSEAQIATLKGRVI